MFAFAALPANKRAKHEYKHDQTDENAEQQEQRPIGQWSIKQRVGQRSNATQHNTTRVRNRGETRASHLLQIVSDLLAVIGAEYFGSASIVADIAWLQIFDAEFARFIRGLGPAVLVLGAQKICVKAARRSRAVFCGGGRDRAYFVDVVFVVLVVERLFDGFLPEAPVDVGLWVAVNVAYDHGVFAQVVSWLDDIVSQWDLNVAHERVRIDVQKVGLWFERVGLVTFEGLLGGRAYRQRLRLGDRLFS